MKYKKFLKDNYGFLFFIATVLSILIKNIILCGYFASLDSTYNPYSFDFLQGFKNFLPFTLFNLAVTLIAVCPALLFKDKGKGVFLIIINIIISALAFLDSISIRSFFDLPTFSLLFLSGAGDAVDEAASLVSAFDIFYWLDFLIFIPIHIIFTIKSKNNKRSFKQRFLSFTSLLIASAFFLFIIPISSALEIDFLNLNGKVYRTATNRELARNFSVFGYHIYDIFEIVVGNGAENPDEKDFEELENYIEWKNEDKEREEHFGIFKDKNIIVIQFESLEEFVLNRKVEGQEITPTINSLLKNSLHFTNIKEQVRMGNSSDCDLLFLTSLAPIDSGSTFQLYGDRKYNYSFPNILKRYEYESYYLHGASNSSWNYAGVMVDYMGFDHMKMDYKATRLLNGYIDDAEMLPQSFEVLKEVNKNPNKFYAHLTLCSSHMPFYLPEEEKALNFSSKLANNKLGKYLESVNYVDRLLGVFINDLEKEGILDNAVLVILGDHNGVHKYYSHDIERLMKNYESDWITLGLDSVPLIVYEKNAPSEEVSTLGGQIDIMPTLLYSLGVEDEDYKYTSLGRNLLNTDRQYFCEINGNVKGNLSEEDKKIAEDLFVISDKVVRGNMQNKK